MMEEGVDELQFVGVLKEELRLIAEWSLEIWRDYYLPEILTERELDGFWRRSYSEEKLLENVLQGAIYQWIVLAEVRIGFLSFQPEYQTNRLHLGKLYLLPRHHGCGLGRQALAYIQSVAKDLGLAEIYLYVFRKNARAIRAYQRAGFSIDRLEVTALEGGLVYDDAVMICRLTTL
ncbi:MAG: GNAT family N-acetyltransferase [Gammaproteobacteria bacterium]|nr:GNAT family N-acetyltransferase [Gammaproteobacteria bacterium]NBY22953.1 GNAT family N-acetyltransferase [Gammaproteobacteria bacterium]